MKAHSPLDTLSGPSENTSWEDEDDKRRMEEFEEGRCCYLLRSKSSFGAMQIRREEQVWRDMHSLLSRLQNIYRMLPAKLGDLPQEEMQCLG